MATKTFSVRLPENNIVIEYTPGKGEIPDVFSSANEIERRVKNFLRLDKLVHTIESQREAEKLAIIELVGKRARYIRSLKRRRKIGIFYNRFNYDLNLLRERLGKQNEDVFDETVDCGLVARLILPSNEHDKDDVAAVVMEFAERYDGQVDIYDHLENFVREDLLRKRAIEREVPLSGTRTPVINMRVYDESTRQSK